MNAKIKFEGTAGNLTFTITYEDENIDKVIAYAKDYLECLIRLDNENAKRYKEEVNRMTPAENRAYWGIY